MKMPKDKIYRMRKEKAIREKVETKTTEQIIDEFYLIEKLKGNEVWVRKEDHDAEVEKWRQQQKDDYAVYQKKVAELEKEIQKLKEPIIYEVTDTDNGKKTTITVQSYEEIKNALVEVLQRESQLQGKIEEFYGKLMPDLSGKTQRIYKEVFGESGQQENLNE